MSQRWGWGRDQIRDAESNEEAYRTIRGARSKPWHRTDKVTTLIPTAIAGIFLLLVLLWIVLFIVS